MAKAVVKTSDEDVPAKAKAPPANLGKSMAGTGEPNLVADLYTGSAEQTFKKSAYDEDSFQEPFNPDELWKKAGSYRLYEEMLLDDQIGVCLQLKKDLVLGSGYDIMSEDESQADLCKEIRCSLEDNSEVPFLDQFSEVLTAYDYGLSLTEKIFDTDDDGSLYLKALRTRNPNTFRIHQDDKGVITRFEQMTVNGNKDINLKAVLHYVNNPKFQNPYGRSDLRVAYAAWFTKRQIIKYFAIFLESSAKPIPVARYDKNAPQRAVEDIHNALKQFQVKTCLTIPKEIEVTFLEAKNSGDAYTKAINLMNMFIGRALFVPDLLGLTGSETGGGSHALGTEHMKIFFRHITRRQTTLEHMINRHFVRPICQYNYGELDSYPVFKFKPPDDGQANDLAKTWITAMTGGIYEPSDEEINHFRGLLRFPEGDVERPEPPPAPVVVAPGHPLDPNSPNHDPNAAPPKGAVPPIGGKPGAVPAKPGAVPPPNPKAAVPPAKGAAPAADPASDDKKKFGKVYDVTPGPYARKVDFKQIKTKLDDYDHSIVNDVQPIIKKMLGDLADQVEKKKIIQGQNADRIDSLKLKYLKDLKQVLKQSFLSLYKDAQSQAQQELQKSNFAAPITDQDFLDLLDSETFAYVGDYSYAMLKKVRAELLAAIKDGTPLSTVLDTMSENGELNDFAQTSIDRFARTKHTEVLNKGRLNYFQESGVVAGYQYSAILDDRTSEICRGLHGKKFKAGTEPVPPMHFNCRSLLIPITKYEEFEPSENVGQEDIQDFIEENKGDGFATK